MIHKTFVYSMLWLNISLLFSCCSAGKVPENNPQPETTGISREIIGILVLDEKTDIDSPWTNRFLLPVIPDAFMANDFTYKRGAVKLNNSSARYGQRIIEKKNIGQRDAYTIYRITMEIAFSSRDPDLTNAYTHLETVRTTFGLTDLIANGKIVYQPARYALLKSIEKLAAPRGQAGLSTLEYTDNGQFRAEVNILY